MSWSILFIGKPENISAALAKHSEGLSGQSKEEYDAALPHLTGLVNLNFNKQSEVQVVKITASGHGYSNGEQKVYGTCQASIEPLGSGALV